MYRLIIFLFCSLLVSSCEKDKKTTTLPTLTLNELQVTGDDVLLTWSTNINSVYAYYTVLRKIHPDSAEIMVAYVQGTTFTDTSVPISPYVAYRISFTDGYTTLNSNGREYSRPEIKLFNYDPFEVLYDVDNKQLYLFESTGSIAKYDIQSEALVTSISTSATLGYPYLVKESGQTRIYVPRNDGWIFIYNGNLEQVGQINAGGVLSCVTRHNDFLVIGFRPNVWSSSLTKTYQLTSGLSDTIIAGNASDRHINVPGSNLDLISTDRGSGYSLKKMSLTGTGVYLSQTWNTGIGYPTDADMILAFPDGQRLVSSDNGIIYGTDLSYVSSLPRGTLHYTGFGFNSSTNSIYAGCDDKALRIYSASDYHLEGTRQTKAYPFRIFNDNGNIIVVGKTELRNYNNPYGPTPKTLIEKYQ